MTLLFSPPSVNDGAAYRADADVVTRKLWGHFARHSTGVTVMKVNGVYIDQQYPYHDDLAAADIVYLGGHIYEVTEEEADDLIAAGYDVYPAVPKITVFGAPADLLGLQSSRDLRYTEIDGMVWEAGTTAFGCAVLGDMVYVGALTASTNSVNYSYTDATLHAFNSETNQWTVIQIRTDLGHTGVLGSSGFTVCDVPAIFVTQDKAVALAGWDYNNWNIATWGRYPAWIALDGSQIDYDLSYTIPELRANAADGNGALSFPDQTNIHAETYASNRGMAACSVLPNGWVAVVDYFALSASGIYSGRLKVFNPDGVEMGFYQWPDMTTEDGIDVQMAPKFITVDPSSTDPTDYRMIVNFDIFVRGTSDAVPFMVQEMAYNSVTGDITPICAPTGSASQNETADWSDYTGSCTARPVFSDDGTCWASTSTRGTFNMRSMGVWLKTAGERRWATENPASPGWETNLGAVRVVPDFELGALEQNTQLHSGQYIDPTTGGHVVVGFNGGLFPFHPDDPLALRPTLLVASDFASDITGAGSFGGSGAATHDAGNGGRLKFTANGSAMNGVWVAPGGGGFTDLPADAEGQSLWAWGQFEPDATERSVQVQVTFHDDDGTQIESTTGPTIFETLGTPVKATCPVIVPAGAAKFQVYFRVLSGGTAAEIHYCDAVYAALAPVTHLEALNLELADLPRDPADARWPAGSSSRDAVDENGIAWLPITLLENSGTTQPAHMPQYLVRLNLPAILNPEV